MQLLWSYCFCLLDAHFFRQLEMVRSTKANFHTRVPFNLLRCEHVFSESQKNNLFFLNPSHFIPLFMLRSATPDKPGSELKEEEEENGISNCTCRNQPKRLLLILTWDWDVGNLFYYGAHGSKKTSSGRWWLWMAGCLPPPHQRQGMPPGQNSLSEFLVDPATRCDIGSMFSAQPESYLFHFTKKLHLIGICKCQPSPSPFLSHLIQYREKPGISDEYMTQRTHLGFTASPYLAWRYFFCTVSDESRPVTTFYKKMIF